MNEKQLDMLGYCMMFFGLLLGIYSLTEDHKFLWFVFMTITGIGLMIMRYKEYISTWK